MKITPEQLDTMLAALDEVQSARKDAKGRHYMSYAWREVELAENRCVRAAAVFAPKAIAHIRFTEASTEDALLILDDAVKNVDNLRGEDFLAAIDFAIQKLRPVAPPVHDAAALAQLAKEHPIELPWMQEGGEQV